VADRLIKDEFHRYARIGTGKEFRKGLFIDGVLSQDGQIVHHQCRLIGDYPLVACKQCVQGCIGAQAAFGIPL
jgi:hypothetical protein